MKNKLLDHIITAGIIKTKAERLGPSTPSWIKHACREGNISVCNWSEAERLGDDTVTLTQGIVKFDSILRNGDTDYVFGECSNCHQVFYYEWVREESGP